MTARYVGSCTLVHDRKVYLVQKAPDGVPVSPSVYEAILVTSDTINQAAPADIPVENAYVAFQLMKPMTVTAGDGLVGVDMYVDGCILSSQLNHNPKNPDKTYPPPADRDFWCTGGAALSGCGAMNGGYPGVGAPTWFALDLMFYPLPPMG